MEKFLVTSALPYANGKLHIGHLAGAYLPADIFVRFLKLNNKDVIYICGTDEHGAPISIKAEAEGVTPQDIVDRYHKIIKESFAGVSVDFDNFSGTAKPRHHKLSQEVFTDLLDNGFITTKTSEQFYCNSCERYLADRYVEGKCPHCGADGARGDQCDNCGHLIDSVTLIEPKCKVCSSTPVVKETSHWYLDLPQFEPKLREWLETKTYWKDNVYNFIMSWLDNGLIERAVTRDINWGVPVPIEGSEGKVLYVWLDAPIGYISATIEWAEQQGNPDLWKDYWMNKETKLIHFIGKDNIPFHTIIWPATIMGQNKDFILPHDVPANEYLNLEGKQLSTSRNWAIWVDEYLEKFDGDYLRYVLAANAPESKDSDFSWKDFQAKVNNDLANVLGNLANRVFTFAKKYFDQKIERPESLSDLSSNTLKEAMQIIDEIKDNYSNYKVRKACKNIIEIARIGNRYFDERKPWVSVKTDKNETQESLFVCAELLRLISIVFSPIIPNKMLQLREMMNLSLDFNWNYSELEVNEFQLGEIKPLFQKIEDKIIAKEIEDLENKAKLQETQKALQELTHKENIDFESFMNMEMRIVKIIEATEIKKSKKLLHLKVKIANETRDVVSGIKGAYKPEELVGKKVAMLLNLAERKMMGKLSQGMILAAEDFDGTLSLLCPDKDISAGSEIS